MTRGNRGAHGRWRGERGRSRGSAEAEPLELGGVEPEGMRAGGGHRGGAGLGRQRVRRTGAQATRRRHRRGGGGSMAGALLAGGGAARRQRCLPGCDAVHGGGGGAGAAPSSEARRRDVRGVNFSFEGRQWLVRRGSRLHRRGRRRGALRVRHERLAERGDEARRTMPSLWGRDSRRPAELQVLMKI